MESKQDENLWTKMLSGFTKSQKIKDANILVFGDYNSGKRSLVSQLENLSGDKNVIESRSDASVMSFMRDKKVAGQQDYRFYSVKDPDDENNEQAKVNIWIIDPKADKDLLSLIINKEVMQNLMVMFVLDFECYWKIMDNLHDYMQIVASHLLPHMKELSLKEADAMKERVATFVKNYIEPKTTNSGKVLTKRSVIDPENWDSYTLPDGQLNTNYGFPIFVSCNKCDHIFEMRKNTEELKMIEYSIRNFGLDYAASIFYTSCKMQTNIQTLFSYINYYFFDVPHYVQVNVSKDAQFIPSGYDNPTVLNDQNSSCQNKLFEEVIKKPTDKKQANFNKEQVIEVRSHQKFLNELKEFLGNSEESKPVDFDSRASNKFEKMRSKDTRTSSGAQPVQPNQTQKIQAMLKEKKMAKTSGTDEIKSKGPSESKK